MNHNPKTSTKKLIHITQLLIRLQLLVINQKCTLNTHMTISTLRKISMLTLILLIHKKKKDYMVNMNMNNSLKTHMKKITEEELENIHPGLNHNFTSPTMNSGTKTVHHNDPEKIIDDLEYFRRYCS